MQVDQTRVIISSPPTAAVCSRGCMEQGRAGWFDLAAGRLQRAVRKRAAVSAVPPLPSFLEGSASPGGPPQVRGGRRGERAVQHVDGRAFAAVQRRAGELIQCFRAGWSDRVQSLPDPITRRRRTDSFGACAQVGCGCSKSSGVLLAEPDLTVRKGQVVIITHGSRDKPAQAPSTPKSKAARAAREAAVSAAVAEQVGHRLQLHVYLSLFLDPSPHR